jgi:hypothetical protein
MTALMNTSSETMTKVAAARAVPRAARGPAIEQKALVGPELNIKVALTPGMVTLIAAPVTVGLTMLTAWVALTTLGMPIFKAEMMGAGIVSALGGMFASIPLFLWMKNGAEAIARAGLMSIGVRCVMILLGMCALFSPAWGLVRMPTVYWILAFYFPLLIVETAVVAWLSQKAQH